MRGTPSLHLILLAFMFAVLAIPLVRLTGARPGSAVLQHQGKETPELAAPGIPTFVTIRYAHRPDRVTISVAGKTLLQETRFDESPLETDVIVPAWDEDLEMAVQASWPAGTPETALTIALEPEAVAGRSATLWSLDGGIDTVLNFAWSD